MTAGAVSAIYRYPVKGFTPEPLTQTQLRLGEGIAHDRAFAVENGPSGFDPAAPAHIAKMRFTVLASIPEVACVRTRYDDAAGVLHADTPGHPPIAARLKTEEGRQAFAAWLTSVLGEKANPPLRVFEGPGAHRFFDHPRGALSAINLESVRDLERRLGRPVDPLRFRANLHIEGWPAWRELDAMNASVELGETRLRVFSPIRRCMATHVDPGTGVRDIDMLHALRTEYGHLFCGVYLHVEKPGAVRAGDEAVLEP